MFLVLQIENREAIQLSADPRSVANEVVTLTDWKTDNCGDNPQTLHHRIGIVSDPASSSPPFVAGTEAVAG